MRYNSGIDVRSHVVNTTTLLAIFAFLCGFLASQRFALGALSSYICVLPYALFVWYLVSNKLDTALSFLVVSLFLATDNGGGAYPETPSAIRYLIYISCVFMLGCLSRPKVEAKTLFFLATLFFVLLAITYSSDMVAFDANTFRRDVSALIILSLALLYRGKTTLSLPLLYCTTFGYLIGELLNIAWFFSYHNDYLNYNGLKAFIVFPFLYAVFFKRNLILSVTLFFLTFLVLVNYGSRMLVSSFVGLLLVSFLVNNISNYGRILVIAIITSSVVITFYFIGVRLVDLDVLPHKTLRFVFDILTNVEEVDFIGAIKLLDPVRFAEHQMFFSRPVAEVIFGSGLGSGMVDTTGLLANVGFNQTAFSDEELISSLFFGFHDYWIDFGLRFGFVVVIYMLYLVSIGQMLKGRMICGILFGLLLINTTFATSGMIFTALIIKFYPASRSSLMETNTRPLSQ